MSASAATERYLTRYAEPQARATWPFGDHIFDHVVVVPAYDERRSFIDQALARDDAVSWLLIVVVNARGNADPAATARTRELLTLTPDPGMRRVPCSIGRAWIARNGQRGLWLIDAVSTTRCFGPNDGVGLARKIGLDIALAHIDAGRILKPLMLCTDADANWPADYFDQRIDNTTSALTFGFRHVGPAATSAAQTVYDQRLRDYPRELTRVGSPYGFQALGSAMALSCAHYAQAGGCPRRLAGEDFHLLAKLAKLGRIDHRPRTIMEIRARHSTRVPFGTGPGVRDLSTHHDPASVPFFIATRSFELLGLVISALREAVCSPSTIGTAKTLRALHESCEAAGLSAPPEVILETEAMRHAVARARAASANPRRRMVHIMTWFDALKTLRFVHRLRDAGFDNVSYAQLKTREPLRLARGCAADQEEDPALALGSSPSSEDSDTSDCASFGPTL